MASVKKKPPNSEVSKQVGFFDLIQEKEEHTLDKILGKRILSPVKTLSGADAEIQRRSKLVSEFRVRYLASINSYILRGFVLDVVMFNRSCEDLVESMNLSGFDRVVIDILKNVIREVATDNLRLTYIHSSPQIEMIRFIKEYNNYIEDIDSNKIVNRAYKEVSDEIREMRIKKNKTICI